MANDAKSETCVFSCVVHPSKTMPLRATSNLTEPYKAHATAPVGAPPHKTILGGRELPFGVPHGSEQIIPFPVPERRAGVLGPT